MIKRESLEDKSTQVFMKELQVLDKLVKSHYLEAL